MDQITARQVTVACQERILHLCDYRRSLITPFVTPLQYRGVRQALIDHWNEPDVAFKILARAAQAQPERFWNASERRFIIPLEKIQEFVAWHFTPDRPARSDSYYGSRPPSDPCCNLK